jgi:outer membrane protein OmpA-like peptidoglycan-associated protein
METQPMPHAHVTRRSSLRRALMPAVVLSLLPLGTAFAQSFPYVRVTRDKSDVRSLRQVNDVKMTAPQGVVLEVIYVEGDRYAHRDSNWYWVLLPRDPWATRPAGWIRGDAVELVAPPETASARTASLTSAPEMSPAASTSTASTASTATTTVPAPEVVREVPTARPTFPDVVLNFQFGRSELTDEAKSTLANAISIPKANARMLSVAIEGHADWTGSEGYNDRLGLARAETVRRYLAEQFEIPADQISVVSYGENNPSAPNTTREGRALNRRVVIKGGA